MDIDSTAPQTSTKRTADDDSTDSKPRKRIYLGSVVTYALNLVNSLELVGSTLKIDEEDVLLNEDSDNLTWQDDDNFYFDDEENPLDRTLVSTGIESEATSLDAFSVYEPVPLEQATSKEISTRWVLKLKDFSVKARLVARGFEQLWTRALTALPTPSLTTRSTLLTLAIASDSSVNTYQVATAFLHSDLQKHVFLMPSPELQGTPRCPDGRCWKRRRHSTDYELLLLLGTLT